MMVRNAMYPSGRTLEFFGNLSNEEKRKMESASNGMAVFVSLVTLLFIAIYLPFNKQLTYPEIAVFSLVAIVAFALFIISCVLTNQC